MSDHSSSFRLQRCLDRLRAGDLSARDELLQSACRRLTRLTRAMLKDYQRLRRWEDSGDVSQNALVRLHRALQEVAPPTVRDFYRLAALQIRRELIDLARHYFGPEGHAAHHNTQVGRADASNAPPPAYEKSDSSLEPSRVAAWGEFHQQAEALPEDEREVFDLLWYQGLNQTEAAEVLGVAVKTVKRRWQAACLKLHAAMHGEMPGL